MPDEHITQQPGMPVRPPEHVGAPSRPMPVQQPHGVASFAGMPLSSAGKRFGAYLLEGMLLVVTLGIGWLVWSRTAAA